MQSKAIPVLKKQGRRPMLTSQEQKDLVCKAWRENDAPYAVVLEHILDSKYARHISHNRIHAVLREMNLASDEPKKRRKKKWIRYERTYSNSLWHTDWKYLKGKGWLIAYLDDASRFIVSYGLFENATSENTVAVLKEAIKKSMEDQLRFYLTEVPNFMQPRQRRRQKVLPCLRNTS